MKKRFVLITAIGISLTSCHKSATAQSAFPTTEGQAIFADSGISSIRLFLDSTMFGTEIGEVARTQSYHYVGYDDIGNPDQELIEEVSLQKSEQATSDMKDGEIILTAYRSDTLPPSNIGNLRWRDTIQANEIRYGTSFIEASTFLSAETNPAGSRERTLYRYFDGKPVITLTSAINVVEDPDGIQRRYVGYLNTNAKYWNKVHQESSGSWIGTWSDTFAIVSLVNPIALQGQYLVIKTTDAANDMSMSFHCDFRLYEWCKSVTLTRLKNHKQKDTGFGHADSTRNEEHWIQADLKSFDILLRFGKLTNTTVRIPVRNGKMEIPKERSKWFDFELR